LVRGKNLGALLFSSEGFSLNDKIKSFSEAPIVDVIHPKQKKCFAVDKEYTIK
jgi:hypothetical protein